MDIDWDNKSTCNDISSLKSIFYDNKNQVVNSNNDDNKNRTSKKITVEEEK